MSTPRENEHGPAARDSTQVTQRRGIVQRQHVTGYDQHTAALRYGGGL
jgi:hypothetical protein